MKRQVGATPTEQDEISQISTQEQNLLNELSQALEQRDELEFEIDPGEIQRVVENVRCHLQKTRTDEEHELKLRLLQQSHRTAQQNSRSSTLESLGLELGRLADQYSANQAWIYLASREDRELVLRAVVTHRADHRGLKIVVQPDTSGIVSQAALGRKSILATRMVPAAPTNPENGGTISELAVPIFDAEDERLLGVLSFESSLREFHEEDRRELEVAARRLAVPLICLHWNSAPGVRHWPWSPAHGKWDTSMVPQQVCMALVRALGYGDSSDDCSTILWYVDWRKGTLRVQGTTYYDTMYIAEQEFPFASYTGAVARMERGEVEISTPQDSRFVMRERAVAAGLQDIVSAPIYRLDEFGDAAPRATGVLHTYYFRESEIDSDRLRREFADIAFLVEDWLAHYERIRRLCALSFLRWKLEAAILQTHKLLVLDSETDSGLLRGWQLCVLRDVLTNVLVADGCSIFVPNEERQRLVLVTSTGVGIRTPFDTQCIVRQPDNGCPLWYELGNPQDERYGLVSYLCEHPEAGPIRINSLLRFEAGEERGLPDELPRRVIWSHMEQLDGDNSDRRFLGMAIRDDSGNEVVVRLVRTMQQPPFTEEDAELLSELLRMCGTHDFFVAPTDSETIGSR